MTDHVSNLFEVLGVSVDATQDEIKKAYRRLVLKHHPDTGDADLKQYEKVSHAYEVLRDPVKRSKHIEELTNEARERAKQARRADQFDDLIGDAFGGPQKPKPPPRPKSKSQPRPRPASGWQSGGQTTSGGSSQAGSGSSPQPRSRQTAPNQQPLSSYTTWAQRVPPRNTRPSPGSPVSPSHSAGQSHHVQVASSWNPKTKQGQDRRLAVAEKLGWAAGIALFLGLPWIITSDGAPNDPLIGLVVILWMMVSLILAIPGAGVVLMLIYQAIVLASGGEVDD